MNHGLKNYIVFWLSQALSQLGSAMTGFTLILWAYEQNGSAMTVSLMSFFHYIPYIIASIKEDYAGIGQYSGALLGGRFFA